MVLLNMATETRKKRHQYSLFDTQYGTITRNGLPGASADQPKKGDKYLYYKLRRRNTPSPTLTRLMFSNVTGSNMQIPEALEGKANETPPSLATSPESPCNDSAHVKGGWQTIRHYAAWQVSPAHHYANEAQICSHGPKNRRDQRNTSE